MSTSLVVLVSYALLSGPAPSWIANEKLCDQTSLSPTGSVIRFAAGGSELDFERGGEQGDSVLTFPIRQRHPQQPDEACVDKTMRFEDVGGIRADRYYPPEERAERATVRLPHLASVDARSAVLSIREGTHQLGIGGTADGWTLLETLSKPRPIAVLSRLFDHWGLIVYLAKDGPVAQIRMPVGKLECVRERDVRFPADYFARLIESQTDILGNRVLEKHGEPSYENMLGFLAPLQAYTFLGDPKSKVKRIVQPNGAIGMLPNRWGGDKPLTETLLDPKEVLLSETNQEDIATPPFEESRLQAKRGLAGRHLPAIDFGFFDPESSYGFRWEALMEPGTSGAVYTRLADTSGRVRYHRIGSGAGEVESLEHGKPFFAALLACHRKWDEFFAMGMRLEVNDPRARDEVRASLARAMSGYVDLHPKYGMGYYWGADDLHDGFPPTTLSLCTTLLAWGHVDDAKRYLGYYLEHFAKPDGTLLYYGPAVAEYGELLELAVAVARQSDDAACGSIGIVTRWSECWGICCLCEKRASKRPPRTRSRTASSSAGPRRTRGRKRTTTSPAAPGAGGRCSKWAGIIERGEPPRRTRQ